MKQCVITWMVSNCYLQSTVKMEAPGHSETTRRHSDGSESPYSYISSLFRLRKDMPSTVSFRKRNRWLVYSHNHNNRRIEDIKTPPPEIWLVPPSSDSSGETSNPKLRVPQLVENQSSNFTHALSYPLQKLIKWPGQACGIITADIFIEHHYGWRTEASWKQESRSHRSRNCWPKAVWAVITLGYA
jgi:hypothetical protein